VRRNTQTRSSRLIVPGPTRRQFISRSAMLAGGVVMGPTLLSACGGDDESGSGGGNTVRISNWPLYMVDGFNEDFTKATGIEVDYKENFQDNETWFAANKDALNEQQDIGADLVVPSYPMTGRLMSLGWLDEIDKGNVPNAGNLRPDLEEAAWDPGAKYSLPYVSGFVGLAYNEAATGRPITSIDDLWDPAFKGKVSLFSDFQDGLGMIMMSQGGSPADPTVEAVQQAADLVASENDKGQIRRFTGNDYSDDLTNGNVVVCQAYSGDVVQLQLDNPDLRFVVPDGGGTQFVDTMVIPYTTQNKEGAEAWMNYVYDRKNYARLIEYVQYIPVLSDMTDELAALDPELAQNPLINPPQEVLDRVESWAILDEETESEMIAIYTDVTGG
jgi:spermidine/putrescine transport system substrate-binding protein